MLNPDTSRKMRVRAAQEDAARQTPQLVGSRLRKLRRYLKIEGCEFHTQKHLAELANIQQSTLSNYEKGKDNVMLPVEVALVFCAAFAQETQLKLEWLYRGDDSDIKRSFRQWLSNSG